MSSARASCSLSTCDDTESDVVESRRGRVSTGEGGAEGPKDDCLCPLGLAMASGFRLNVGRVFAPRPGSRKQSACFGSRDHAESKECFGGEQMCCARAVMPRFEGGARMRGCEDARIPCWGTEDLEVESGNLLQTRAGTAKARRRPVAKSLVGISNPPSRLPVDVDVFWWACSRTGASLPYIPVSGSLRRGGGGWWMIVAPSAVWRVQAVGHGVTGAAAVQKMCSPGRVCPVQIVQASGQGKATGCPFLQQVG